MILSAVKILKSVCDGAHEKDQQGFNMIDTRIASWILSLENPDEDVLWTAWNMLRKYKKQLKGLGIDYDSISEPKKPASSLNTADLKAKFNTQKAIAGFRCIVTPYGLKCFFPYSPKLIDAFRDIFWARFSGADKAWVVPFKRKSLIQFTDVALDHNFPLDDAILNILQEADKYDDAANTVSLVSDKLCFAFEFDQSKIDRLKDLGAKFEANTKNWLLALSANNVNGVLNFILEGFSVKKDVFSSIEAYSLKLSQNLENSFNNKKLKVGYRTAK
jgi:hypothetical protein